MSIVPHRPLDFGEILDAAFHLYRRDFFDYTIVAVVGLAPSYALLGVGELAFASRFSASNFDSTAPAEALAALLAGLGWIGAGAVVAAVAWTALTAAIAMRAQDRRPAFASSYRQALGRLPVVVGAVALACLLAAAVLAGAFACVAVVTAFVAGVAGVGTGYAVVGISAALLVASVLAMVWFVSSTFAVLPAVVVEKAGPWRAIRRSFRLARKARLRIFGVVCIASIMLALPSLALQSFAYGLSSLFAVEPSAAVSASKYWLVQMAQLAVGSFTTPLFVSCTMLLYYDRRIRTEAYDLEAAAASMTAEP